MGKCEMLSFRVYKSLEMSWRFKVMPYTAFSIADLFTVRCWFPCFLSRTINSVDACHKLSAQNAAVLFPVITHNGTEAEAAGREYECRGRDSMIDPMNNRDGVADYNFLPRKRPIQWVALVVMRLKASSDFPISMCGSITLWQCRKFNFSRQHHSRGHPGLLIHLLG